MIRDVIEQGRKKTGDAELVRSLGVLSVNDVAARLGHGRGSSESESSGIKRRQIEVEKRTKVRWGLTSSTGRQVNDIILHNP